MIFVSCAVIIDIEQRVFAAQRSAHMDLPLKWEFPGGKIEQDEDAEACLLREIREELNIEIMVVGRLQPVEHQYPKKKIRLIPFICEKTGGEISLTEHAGFCWLPVDQLGELDWAEADIPIVKEFIERFIDRS